MTAVVEVRFKGNRKEYFAWGSDQPPALESPVIVEVGSGENMIVVPALRARIRITSFSFVRIWLRAIV